MKKNLRVIQFLLFLLLNGALVPFFRNRMIYRGNGILKVMSFVRRYVERGKSVFFAAFVFQDTKEGHHYWDNLSDKWVAKFQQANN